MRIALDASSVATRERSGIGVCLVNLLDSLAAIDRENHYSVCYRLSRLRHWRSLYVPRAPNFHLRVIQEPLLFPRNADVFHDGDSRLPKRCEAPITVNVYDIFSLLRTDLATEEFRRRKCERYREIAARAAGVIAASESTRRDLVKTLDIPADRIHVVYPSISGRFTPRDAVETDRVLRKYGIPSPYLLSVAAFSKRKNTHRLLQAYASLRKQGRMGSTLALVGSLQHWPDWRRSLEEAEVDDGVVVTGYVSDDDLPALYSGARGFLFPSLYEGFGMPLVEAMSCGTPVLTSDVSSMPEVVGDAGVLVHPEDQEEIEQKIAELEANAGLREELSKRGLQRASLFSGERSARKLLDVWQNLARLHNLV